MTNFSNLQRLMAKRESRLIICEHRLDLFARYYLKGVFGFPEAQFQKQDWHDLMYGDHDLLELLQFRESGKTVRAFVKLLHSICYRKRRFICLFAYDKKKAAQRNFQISVQLQTNQRIIDDFGQLFFEDSKDAKKASQSKSKNEFVTTNDIQLKAFSLNTSIRGEIFISRDGQAIRPDFIFLDDVDTIKSLKNPKVLEENWKVLTGEILGAASPDCQTLLLGNVIKSDGIAIRMEKECETNPRWKCNRVAVVDENNKPTWKRYVHTDEQAEILNRNITEKSRMFVSLEKKRRDFGEIGYNQNMLLVPDTGSDSVFKMMYLKYFSPKDKRALKPDRIRIGVDPAVSEKTQSDYFAITVTGWEKMGVDDFGDVIWRFFVYESHKFEGADKDDIKTTKFIKSLYDKYHDTPKDNNIRINFESVVFSALYGKMYQRRRMAADPIHTTKDKVTRAKEFQATFEQGNILFQTGGIGLDGSGGLIENVTEFPNVVHDDQVDSLLLSMSEPDEEVRDDVNIA